VRYTKHGDVNNELVMFKLTVNDQNYSCQSGETVLDALLRQQVKIPYSCKKGSCQSCLIRSADASPPLSAQTGLKNTQKKSGYFLACLCHPEQDMTIRLPDHLPKYFQGEVIAKELLNSHTLLLTLALKENYQFNAGQFVNLQRPDGLKRCYSIANIPQEANTIEFNIRCLPEGYFTSWLLNELKVGDQLAVSEPRGHCFYLPENIEQGLLLVATGTGLGPLTGILQDALKNGHNGPIYLFHGARKIEDLYKIDAMQQLAATQPNFHYLPCLSAQETVPEGFSSGRVNDVVNATLPSLKGWRVFLCGHPDMVNQMKITAFLKGASINDIYADAFLKSI